MSLLIFICLISLFSVNAIYDCNTKSTVYLNYDEIAFFDFQVLTPLSHCHVNFSLNNFSLAENYTVCKVEQKENFYKDNPHVKVPRAVQMVFSSSITMSDIPTEKFITSYLRVNYTFHWSYDFDSLGVLQGAFLFEDWGDDCPLESISRIKPFNFTDETQIILLQSSYFENYTRTHPCKWEFTAPNGYGFKVVIEIFDISDTTYLRIENRTDVFVDENIVKLFHPYYNPDNHLRIYLSKSINNFSSTMEFKAYITVVKKRFDIVDAHCISYKIGDITVWETSNVLNVFSLGHLIPNNAHCQFDLVIHPNTEISCGVTYGGMERGVDYIGYYDESNEFVMILDSITYIIEPYLNGSDKTVSWGFNTDGSIQSVGFIVAFSEIACNCANPNITCEAMSGIMDNADVYCGNLNCTFYIEPCDTELTKFSISVNEKTLYGTFRLYSNGIKIAQLSNDNTLEYLVYYLNSSNENIFEAITSPSSKRKSLTFSTNSKELPAADFHVILSDEKPFYIFDAVTAKLITVEISKELISDNVSVIMYTSNINPVITENVVYSDESLTYRLNDCFVAPHYKCVCKKCVIYTEEMKYSGLIAITMSKKIKGCMYINNVHRISSRIEQLGKTYIVSGLSDNKGSCQIILLIDHEDSGCYISELWTTASTENVKIYVGTDRNHLFLEFNAKTATKWKDIYLFSKSYIIDIPVNSSVFFTLTYAYNNLHLLPQPPYYSMVATPNYRVNNNDSPASFGAMTLDYSVGNFTLQFTIIECNVTPTNEFYFNTSKGHVYANKSGNVVKFRNEFVSVNYDALYDSLDNGVILFVESLNDTDSFIL